MNIHDVVTWKSEWIESMLRSNNLPGKGEKPKDFRFLNDDTAITPLLYAFYQLFCSLSQFMFNQNQKKETGKSWNYNDNKKSPTENIVSDPRMNKFKWNRTNKKVQNLIKINNSKWASIQFSFVFFFHFNKIKQTNNNNKMKKQKTKQNKIYWQGQ